MALAALVIAHSHSSSCDSISVRTVWSCQAPRMRVLPPRVLGAFQVLLLHLVRAPEFRYWLAVSVALGYQGLQNFDFSIHPAYMRPAVLEASGLGGQRSGIPSRR